MTRNGKKQYQTLYPTSPWTDAFANEHEDWAAMTNQDHDHSSNTPASFLPDADQQPTLDALTNVYNWGHPNG